MANDTRNDSVGGFKAGMAAYANHSGKTFKYTIRNAKNRKDRLPALAEELISLKPDIVIAAGGIEADALKDAVKNAAIPVVFLSVASSIDRGLSLSMTAPDKNITGIDTNDTNMTAKRLWFIKHMLPETRTVMCYHVPSIIPSVESIEIAKQKAVELDIKLIVENTETLEDIKKATAGLARAKVDVILLNPVAPIHGTLESIIFPKALSEKIPIFGYGMGCMKNGSFASYAGSRYANGKQAARLAYKIIHGTKPVDIPIETPENYELVINSWLVKSLGLNLPNRIWKMADKVIDKEF